MLFQKVQMRMLYSLVAVLLSTSPVFGQESRGRILGRVVDSTAAVVDGSIIIPVDIKVPVRHVIVYAEPGRSIGWPAILGLARTWGDEIVLGVEYRYYKERAVGHQWDTDRPRGARLLRSRDGGETWSLENPDNWPGGVGDYGKVLSNVKVEQIPFITPTKDMPEGINFEHPDLALVVHWDRLFLSYDRGKSWARPYLMPDFGAKIKGITRLTSRNDYVVEGPKSALFFLSALEERHRDPNRRDRVFCVRTDDGGKSFEFLSWVGEPARTAHRSVMPSTVRVGESHLITAVRRRIDERFENRRPRQRNWIDIYESTDNGRTWEYLTQLAETHENNGNPPDLIKLTDGRLVLTYGLRSVPFGIRATISANNGRSWSREIILRDDAYMHDLGYNRSVQRGDGKIVTFYYYNTREKRELHIAATIWYPPRIEEGTSSPR